jgi:hypothetical protein
LIRGENEGEYAIPAVGRISINLSLSDVAGLVAVALFRGAAFFTGALGLVDIFGADVALGATVTFGFGVTGFGVTGFGAGFRDFLGAGATVVLTFGPLPFRPSIIIFPSCV